MAAGLPSIQQPAVNPQSGFFSTAWIGFFSQLIAPPGKITFVGLGASPFTFEATQDGTLSIVGGTVTAIAFTRARTTIGLATTSGLIAMAQGDAVQITYSGTPSLYFIPRGA